MQKIIGIVLCVLLALSMAACQPAKAPSAPPTHTPTSPPTTENTEDAPLHTFYSLSVPAEIEYLYHENGTLLFEYAYQHIQMQIADQNVADKITLDFLNRVDSTRSNAEAISQQSRLNYDGSDLWSPYKYHIYYSPTRVDQGIISLFGTRTTFTGGMHPEQSCLSVSYDVANGDYLTLGSILNHIDNKEDLCDLVLEELDKLDYQYSLFDGYENAVLERFAADESTDENFYFTNSGLCFYFSPYELAPFSTGIITVEIPYSELPGILNDAYFPDEHQPSTGKLIAENVDKADTGTFAQLMEVVLHPQGEQVLLYSDKTVRNVTITCGSWTPDGLYFLPDYVVFSATGVSADKAIVIRLSIPEMLPNLMLSYETIDETKQFYISKSAEDGSVLLLPVE